MLTVCGAILAGGESSRMGALKEGVLLPDGRAMIEHVAEALRPLVRRTVVVGTCRGFDHSRIGAERIDDIALGLGPMGGVAAVLRSGLAERYLIIPCDMPFATSEVLSALVNDSDPCSAVCLRSSDGTELAPFPCLLPASAMSAVDRHLKEGRGSLKALFRDCGVVWSTVNQDLAWRVKGINTEQELATCIASLAAGRFRPS